MKPAPARAIDSTRIRERRSALVAYVPASTSNAAPGPIRATIEPPIAAPTGNAAFRAMERSPFACWSSLVRHDLPHEPVRRGRVEGDRGAAARLERDQLPDLGVAREEEHAHRRPDGRARDVGADHHEAARQPVADDAAEREHRDLRERPRREAEADRRSRRRRCRGSRTRRRSARGTSRRTRSPALRRGSESRGSGAGRPRPDAARYASPGKRWRPLVGPALEPAVRLPERHREVVGRRVLAASRRAPRARTRRTPPRSRRPRPTRPSRAG